MAKAASRTQSTDGKATGRYPIAVLAKTFDLLDLLEAQDGLTLTELAGRAGLNKATTLRILANLEDRRYVERDGDGRYRLGVRLLQLGMRKSAGLDLRTVARPVLKRLHAEFGETINLAVPAADGIVYIDIIESAQGLRMAASVGMRDDYHSTAIGKAILAQLAPPALEAVLGQRSLARKTARTIVEPGALRHELALVRARGYALDDEENEASARCVGAPIFDHRGICVAAISASGPTSRLTEERLAGLAERVLAGSREISTMMGYRPAGGDRARD